MKISGSGKDGRTPILLTAPWLDETERERLGQALSGRLAGDGPFCRRVEARLAERLGANRVLLTTSCTQSGPGRR